MTAISNDWLGAVRWRQQDPLAGLLRRIRLGDGDSFEQLHAARSRYLLHVAMRTLGNEAIAQETVQEAYLSVWMKAHLFDPALAGGITWMTTIVRNKAIDLARQRGVHTVCSRGEQDEALDVADDRVDIEREISRARLSARLADCLDEQRPAQRQMLALAYVRGMPQSDIAQALAMPPGSVKGRVRRAQHELRRCLDVVPPQPAKAGRGGRPLAWSEAN